MFTVNSIKKKILIFAILATLIPSAGLGLLSFRQNETFIADNVTHQLRMLGDDASRELEFWLKKQTDDLRALASSDAIINGIPAGQTESKTETAPSPETLSRYLHLVQEKLEPLLELTVLDAHGRVVASGSAAPAVTSLPELWTQTAGKEGMIVDPPHWNEARSTATLSLAVPVLSLDDHLLGTLVAVIDMGGLQTRLDFISDPSPGNLLLLDLKGTTLLATHASVAERSPLDARILEQLVARHDAPITYTGFQGHEVMGLAQQPRKVPVIVVTERGLDDIYRAWVLFRNLFLALLGGLTLLVALIGWRIGRSIVIPLERLTGAAEHIAAGDLTVQLPAAGHDEIGRLTRVFNRMTDNLRGSRDEIETATRALQQQNRLLETLSITDNLTGLFNRNKLNEILAEQLALHKRHRRPFAVLLLDIDHFKALNDNYGHLAGDEVLKRVATILSNSIRSVDYAARYGGEEFVIVLPETTTDTARELAERIRSRIQNSHFEFEHHTLATTLSIGIASVQHDDDRADSVIARADNALYDAKRGGRNQVCCAE